MKWRASFSYTYNRCLPNLPTWKVPLPPAEGMTQLIQRGLVRRAGEDKSRHSLPHRERAQQKMKECFN